MKGLISIILSGAMLATVFIGSSVTVNAKESAVEDFEINQLDDGTIEIREYIGNDRKVVIPSTLNGKTVTKIGSFAFSDNVRIKSVTIPDTVTYIDGFAFSDCTKLANITIPDSVLYIDCDFEDTAYYKNDKNWEDGALYIDNHLVAVKDSTDSVFEKSTFKIDEYKREEYKIKEGTVSISSFALEFNARKITIPASVKFIDDSALEFIAAEEISVANENKYYHSIDGVLFETESNTLLRYPPLKPQKEYAVPNGVTKLGASSFSHCILNNLTIPDSVTTLGTYMFAYGSLPKIAIPKSVKEIDEHTFSNIDSIKNIDVDSKNKYYYSIDGILFNKNTNKILAYPANKPQADYKIPDNVTEVDLYAFRGSKLTSLTIPASVKSIITSSWFTDKDFYVEAINVDSDNEIYYSVDGVLFEKEDNILIKYPSGKADTNYDVPDGVTTIGVQAFDDANCNLVSVTIPESVTKIQESAFKSCSKLTDVTILNPNCEIQTAAIPVSAKIYGNEKTTENVIHLNEAKSTANSKSSLANSVTILNNPAIIAILVATLILLILLLIIIKRTKKKSNNTQITSDL